jgi:hypothetical protein
MKYIPIYGHQQPTIQKQHPKIELNREEVDLFLKRHKDVRNGTLKGYQTYDLPLINIPLPPLVKPTEITAYPIPHPYQNIQVAVKSTYIPKAYKKECSIDDITDPEYLNHHFKTQSWSESTFCKASDYMLLNAYMRQRASMRRHPLEGSTIVHYARNHCVPVRNVLKFLLDEELRCGGCSPCTSTTLSSLPTEDFDWWMKEQSYQSHKYDSEPMFNYLRDLDLQGGFQREWFGLTDYSA